MSIEMSEQAVAALLQFAEERNITIGMASLILAAEERNIPWLRMKRKNRIQLGEGTFALQTKNTITPMTSLRAIRSASNKAHTFEILRAAGFPVPRQVKVTTSASARHAARTLGGPIVIKPLHGNNGKGVTVNLSSDEEIDTAIKKAFSYRKTILVEQFISGNDYRLLVVAGKLVAAVHRVPAAVIGDGISSIEELVAIANQDPRRGPGHSNILTTIIIDSDVIRILSKHGYTPESIPQNGSHVALRAIGNLSLGGMAKDVTDEVHPAVASMAVDISRAIGLDIAGLDYISPSITEAPSLAGGHICEVNSGPGVRLHLFPSQGKPRNVAQPIVSWLVPPKARVRLLRVRLFEVGQMSSILLENIMRTAGFRVAGPIYRQLRASRASDYALQEQEAAADRTRDSVIVHFRTSGNGNGKTPKSTAPTEIEHPGDNKLSTSSGSERDTVAEFDQDYNGHNIKATLRRPYLDGQLHGSLLEYPDTASETFTCSIDGQELNFRGNTGISLFTYKSQCQYEACPICDLEQIAVALSCAIALKIDADVLYSWLYKYCVHSVLKHSSRAMNGYFDGC